MIPDPRAPAPAEGREKLEWACAFYDRWYQGDVKADAGAVAYELVTAIRQALSTPASPAAARGAEELYAALIEVVQSPLFRRFREARFWDAASVDLVWRHHGRDVREEADWLKDLWYLIQRRGPAPAAPAAPVRAHSSPGADGGRRRPMIGETMTPDQLQWVVDHNQQIRGGHRVQIGKAVEAWRALVARVQELEAQVEALTRERDEAKENAMMWFRGEEATGRELAAAEERADVAVREWDKWQARCDAAARQAHAEKVARIEAERQREALRAAVEAFFAKWPEVEKRVNGIISLQTVRTGTQAYTGPNLVPELEAMRQALSPPAAPPPEEGH